MKTILFFLLIFTTKTAFTQLIADDSLRRIFSEYQSQAWQEKIFVHTDKSFYVAGEIMWFKLYNVDAATHKPVDVSKVSYVEIVNTENKPVLQAKIKMQNGNGNGSFLLPFSINSGTYILKAYTNRMKNFSPDYYFEKQITIVNTLKKEEDLTITDSLSYDIQFFPEGGNLVNGLQSTVAFKAVNQYGQSISFSGFLINQNNDTIVRFQPYKFGMGKFSFTPSSGNKYRVFCKVKNKLFTKPFPQVYEQGYVMKLASENNNQISVTVSTNIASSNYSYIYLFVHSQQSVKSVQVRQLINGNVAFILDKDSLDEGITHLTIFNGFYQPLCERLYFKQPKQQLVINVKADQPEYGTRKKLQLQINTQNQSSQPVGANLSLSVFRLDSLQTIEPTNIFNYVWLNSEIKGNIESPDFYFKDTSNETKEALDNLMLTQGWRRFKWEDALQNNKPVFSFLPEYEGHIITGKITSYTTGLPAKNVTAYLSIPGEKFSFSTAISDDSGNIAFTINRFYGAGEAIVQTSDTTENAYRVTLNNPFSQTPVHTSVVPFTLSENWKNQLLENSIGVQTQNAYFSNERDHFILSNELDTTVFYGKPDKRYLLDDYTRFPTMEEVIREYVTEVRLSKQGGAYHYTVDNLPYRVFFKDDPLVLLDGVPVWNINKIIAVSPLLIRQLDVVTHKYFLGDQTFNGIVSYSTYNGDVGGLQLSSDAVQIEYEGFQLDREFYSPIYETSQQINSRLPDFRNLLYWSPDINTDNSGKQVIEFYTSDLGGNYAIVLQGNTANGLAGCKVINISIHK